MAAKRRKLTLADVVTKAGLFSIRSEAKPWVRVREEKVPGSNLVLDFKHPRTGRRVKETLEGTTVRNDAGKIDWQKVEQAQERANDRAAELRLDRERFLDEPQRITVGRAFALFHDPAKGGLLGRSQVYRSSHRRAREFWEAECGVDLPWNQITPGMVQAGADKVKGQGHSTKAVMLVDRLHTVWSWLTDQQDIEGLKNPTRKFDKKAFLGGHRPKRPRFGEDELVKLIHVARQVDPRFRLFIGFADTSGSRGVQIRTAWRSAWNTPLGIPWEEVGAVMPHGWLVLRGVKGQADQIVPLTDWQLEELVAATGGYWDEAEQRFQPGHLSILEERYLEKGDDYPLFPGGYLRKGMASGHVRNYTPIGRTEPWNWLVEAEALAKVDHVPGRGLHGIRRAWAKYSRREIGKTAAARAGGWSKEETMEQIYAGERLEDLAASREAQQRRRRQNRPDL